MAPLLAKEERLGIERSFREKLEGDVRLSVFTSRKSPPYSAETVGLLEEVSALSPKVKLTVLDLSGPEATAAGADSSPTTVITTAKGSKLYFVGIPIGRQLGCLVEGIVDASRGRTEMDETTRETVARVQRETEIKVFAMPSCAFSPLVVRSAHRFALENPKIHSYMIESIEFPALAKRYGVVGVPRTVINGRSIFDGAPSEKEFAQKVLEASATA